VNHGSRTRLGFQADLATHHAVPLAHQVQTDSTAVPGLTVLQNESTPAIPDLQLEGVPPGAQCDPYFGGPAMP